MQIHGHTVILSYRQRNYEEPESLKKKKNYKTSICYLKEVRKFSLTVSYSEHLDSTSRTKECVERDVFRSILRRIDS